MTQSFWRLAEIEAVQPGSETIIPSPSYVCRLLVFNVTE